MKSIALLLALLSTTALAQFRFSGHSHRGSGCAQNTISFTESPDLQSISVLYDNFMVQLPDPLRGQVEGSTIRRRYDPLRSIKQCNLSFSVELEAGHMVEALEVTVFNRGATILDPGIRASLSTSFLGYSAFGGRGAPQALDIEAKQWGPAGVQEDWLSNPTVILPIRFGCASARGVRDIRFDMTATLDAQITNGNTALNGLVTMDSSDVNGGMKIRVVTRRCGGGMTPDLSWERPLRRPRWP